MNFHPVRNSANLTIFLVLQIIVSPMAFDGGFCKKIQNHLSSTLLLHHKSLYHVNTYQRLRNICNSICEEIMLIINEELVDHF